jgi:hypothetical protein
MLFGVFQRKGGGEPFGVLRENLRSQQIKRLVAAAQGIVGEPAQRGRKRQQ